MLAEIDRVHTLVTEIQQQTPQKRGATTVWRINLADPAYRYLQDHQFQNMKVLPGSFTIAAALAVGAEIGLTQFQLADIAFEKALVLPDDNRLEIELVLEKSPSGNHLFALSVGSVSYSRLTLREDAQTVAPQAIPLEKTQSKLDSYPTHYADLTHSGNQYGEAFQSLRSVWRHDESALAVIEPANKGLTLVVDGAVQALASLRADQGSTFVFAAVDQVETYSDAEIVWANAKLTDQSADSLTGNIQLADSAGKIVMTLSGVQLRYLEAEKAQQTLAIAATFTAEPLEPTLNFWAKELDTPFDVQFAPYNQIFQQLLNPNSEFGTNQSGINTILVRLQDWMKGNKQLSLRVDSAEKERLLAPHQRRTLPNRLEIAQLNPYETDYVYHEIFEDKTYLKHNIQYNEGDVIIDIGANIGLFSLFALEQCGDATIYAFEPSPPVFDLLNTNAALYGGSIKAVNKGVSRESGSAEFTFYPKSSVFSSFSADEREDGHAIRAVVENMVREGGNKLSAEELDQFVDELMADRLNSTPYTCQLTSVSDIIRDNGITKIDLLKVDAEKSELGIIRGIDDDHWPMIKQVVMEVHDQEGDILREIALLLKSKGFELVIDEEFFLHQSGLYNICATRPATVAKAAPKNHLQTTADQFVSALDGAAQRANAPHLVVFCPPTNLDPAILKQIKATEAELVEQINGLSQCFAVSSADLMEKYPAKNFYDADGDQLGHVPYSAEFYAGLASTIVRTHAATRRAPYKVIVLDCDNTLWSGVAGEDGPAGVKLSCEFLMLQKFMLKQQEAGLLLCLASKNNPEDAWAIFEQRDDMLLKTSHIVSSRINWQRKSENIRSLAEELNLGLDSFIFIDDNPVECAEVRTMLPEVLTLQLPAETSTIPKWLNHVWAFDQLKTTAEDGKRTAMYQQNIARKQYQSKTLSLSDFIAGLNLNIQVGPMTQDQLPRVSQLTQRTNQFNLSTIRRSISDIQRQMSRDSLNVLTVRVSDRFGDYGLVGVVFYRLWDGVLVVDSFMLSCRVLGRGVEHAMVAKIGRIAQQNRLSHVQLPFVKSAKNEPILNFLTSLESAERRTDTFIFTADGASQVVYSAETSVVVPAKKKAGQANAGVMVDYAKIASKLNSVVKISAGAKAIQQQKQQVSANYVAPDSDMARTISQIWQDILNVNKVGMDDNFADIGGTSLNAVTVVAHMRRQLDCHLSIVDLFETPTIRGLAQRLAQPEQTQTALNGESSRNRGAQRRAQRRNRRRR